MLFFVRHASTFWHTLVPSSSLLFLQVSFFDNRDQDCQEVQLLSQLRLAEVGDHGVQSVNVARGANLPPLGVLKGISQLLKVNPLLAVLVSLILKVCLESHHYHVMVPSNICTCECSGFGISNA